MFAVYCCKTNYNQIRAGKWNQLLSWSLVEDLWRRFYVLWSSFSLQISKAAYNTTSTLTITVLAQVDLSKQTKWIKKPEMLKKDHEEYGSICPVLCWIACFLHFLACFCQWIHLSWLLGHVRMQMVSCDVCLMNESRENGRIFPLLLLF